VSLFWIVGIVLNVAISGLAIWWVVRQMKSPKGDGDDGPS